MSIKLGQVANRIALGFTSFDPIRIGVNEKFNDNAIESNYGRNQYSKINANAEITLEFDSLVESDVTSLRTILNDRRFDKKVFLNEPSTYQTTDFNTHVGPAGQYCGYGKSNGAGPSSITELSSGEYTNIQQIDALNFSYSQGTHQRSWLFCAFDFTNFITTYGKDAIERVTLMLHNPWCTLNSAASGYRVFAWTGAYYASIGEQTYSVSDTTLLAAELSNQQFYSYRKVANYKSIADCFSGNLFYFAICNSTKRTAGNAEVGFNYAAALINGYSVKQSNADNFTYRDPYTGSWFTGTINLAEV